jgi:cytidine deaminase
MTRLKPIELKKLTRLATEARDNAYAPYSNHPVGAALLAGSGLAYPGCNVENAHYNCTHAEASAISAMIAAGEREIRAIVIVGPAMEYLCTPCGDCRQRLREFAKPNLPIYSMWKDGSFGHILTLEKLLPASFGPENLAEVGVGPLSKKTARKKKKK